MKHFPEKFKIKKKIIGIINKNRIKLLLVIAKINK